MEIKVDANGEIINDFNAYGFDSYGIYNNGEGYRDDNEGPEDYSDQLNIDNYKDHREEQLDDWMFSNEMFGNVESFSYGGYRVEGSEGNASSESIDWTEIGYNFETITFDNETPVRTV